MIFLAFHLAAAGLIWSGLDPLSVGPSIGPAADIAEVRDRDKTGTTPQSLQGLKSQSLVIIAVATRQNRQAEGRGLEPPTPYGAPDFESGRWPIRLPSGDLQFIGSGGLRQLGVCRRSPCISKPAGGGGDWISAPGEAVVQAPRGPSCVGT